MNNIFNLEFEELSNTLIQNKIDEYIKVNYHNNGYDEDQSLEELIENIYIREDAKEDISKRFPMYF